MPAPEILSRAATGLSVVGEAIFPFAVHSNVTRIEAGLLQGNGDCAYCRGRSRDAKIDKASVVSSGEDRVSDSFGLFRGC